jgi:hypothetical protein
VSQRLTVSTKLAAESLATVMPLSLHRTANEILAAHTLSALAVRSLTSLGLYVEKLVIHARAESCPREQRGYFGGSGVSTRHTAAPLGIVRKDQRGGRKSLYSVTKLQLHQEVTPLSLTRGVLY